MSDEQIAAIRARWEEAEWMRRYIKGETHYGKAAQDIHDVLAAYDAAQAERDAAIRERDKWQSNFNASLDEIRADAERLLSASSRENALRIERVAALARVKELEGVAVAAEEVDLSWEHPWLQNRHLIPEYALRALRGALEARKSVQAKTESSTPAVPSTPSRRREESECTAPVGDVIGDKGEDSC